MDNSFQEAGNKVEVGEVGEVVAEEEGVVEAAVVVAVGEEEVAVVEVVGQALMKLVGQFRKCSMFGSYLVNNRLDHNLRSTVNSSSAGIVYCYTSRSLLKE